MDFLTCHPPLALICDRLQDLHMDAAEFWQCRTEQNKQFQEKQKRFIRLTALLKQLTANLLPCVRAPPGETTPTLPTPPWTSLRSPAWVYGGCHSVSCCHKGCRLTFWSLGGCHSEDVIPPQQLAFLASCLTEDNALSPEGNPAHIFLTLFLLCFCLHCHLPLFCFLPCLHSFPAVGWCSKVFGLCSPGLC